MAPRLFLFDIDNTLLYSGGAGSLSMGLAFKDMFGVEDGFKGVEFSGRTDRYILATALRLHDVAGSYEEHEERFLQRYFGYLPGALNERQGRLMPGFPELLSELRGRDGLRLGLATGNFSGSAAIKLNHYGIDGYFEGGGFGEESEDRSVIVRNAVQRLGDGLSPSEIVVIGDTPHDISSAKANGLLSVGVATGSNPVDELRGCGADLALEDFSDWRATAASLASL
ncbi:MAG: HAD family hydrolase [Dehalococcoidia bacterium]